MGYSLGIIILLWSLIIIDIIAMVKRMYGVDFVASIGLYAVLIYMNFGLVINILCYIGIVLSVLTLILHVISKRL